MTRNLKKTFVKSYPSYRLLFKWFILEIHKWMGDEEYQNKAVTLEIMQKIMQGLKCDFAARKIDECKEGVNYQTEFVLTKF